MKRVLEPELMDDHAQAIAYVQADFNETDDMFVDRFAKSFGPPAGCVLDLGCGPGNVAFRIARRYQHVNVHAVDGAAVMLEQGERILDAEPDIRDRVKLIQGFIPDAAMPNATYDAIVSNSLLHHLPDPSALWTTVLKYGRPGAPVQVMDLKRPANEAAARELQIKYASDAPAVLREDFYHSLLAAFEPDEVAAQLVAAGVREWKVEIVTDRHLMITGRC